MYSNSVYKRKRGEGRVEAHKARLVLKGCNGKLGFDCHDQIYLHTFIHCNILWLWNMTKGCYDNILQLLSWREHLYDATRWFHNQRSITYDMKVA